jgi:FMN phosphatase YigB (HAD superfamily)
MLQGVLFDLDGTLLDVEVDAFLRRYFAALDATASPRFPGIDLMHSVLASTAVMQTPHIGATNREVFYRDFRERTGVDLDEAWGVFEDFYRDVFPTLGSDYGPAAGAREAVETAKALGLKVAVATQPIFPRMAIEHRLAWAGLEDIEFDAVTTYEIMHACKPQAAYFRQTAELIGCAPEECLMVGDDGTVDMAAAAAGMATFYVGHGRGVRADHRGTLHDLTALLTRSCSPRT